MGVHAYQVTVDQWGHIPRGTTVLINDDDSDKLLYSIDGQDPLPLTADVGHAVRSGSLLEVDDRGNPLKPGQTGGLDFPTGRLPVGDEKALDRGEPSDPDAVPIPSGSAEDADPQLVANPHPAVAPPDDTDEDGLTPAQKAARTRAANRAAEQGQAGVVQG